MTVPVGAPKPTSLGFQSTFGISWGGQRRHRQSAISRAVCDVDVVAKGGYRWVSDPGMLDGVYAVVIRDAEPADLVVVRDVFCRSSLSNDGDRAQLLVNPELLEWSSPPEGRGRTRVAVVDAAIVGFATTTVGADCLELNDLFINPQSVRHGVGRALVVDATVLARDRNVSRIEVTANEQALGFYERVGFVTRESSPPASEGPCACTSTLPLTVETSNLRTNTTCSGGRRARTRTR